MSRTTRAGRQALEHRDDLLEFLKRLSPELIADLDHRGRFLARPDGWPPGGGGEVRGSEVSRPVESAVVARGERAQSDPVGDQIRRLFGALAEAAGVLAPAAHSLDFLRSYGDVAIVRESSLQGDCLCCERPVSGSANDRLRSGFCDACRKAYSRWSEDVAVVGDPAAHRREFVAWRRSKLATGFVEVPGPAAFVCAHGCCSKVSPHEHWRPPAECSLCRARAERAS